VSTEPSVEVLKRLLEADFGGVELAHRGGQPILSEIVWIDLARLRDQFHCAHRRLVVPVGEHVDVGVRDPFAVELLRRRREPAIAQPACVH
jgi:hypothetical protein